MTAYSSTKNGDQKLSSKIHVRNSYLSWTSLTAIIICMLVVRTAHDWLHDYKGYYMKVVMVTLLLLKVIAWRQKSQVKLTYSPTNELFSEFIEKTNISKLSFRPWIMALVPAAQFFWYLVCELFMQKLFPPKYRRETFLAEDGGTLGVDWNIDSAPIYGETKPILLLVPGLSGGNTELYLTTMMHAAIKDYNVGVVLLRGAAGLQMTSAKFSTLMSSDDVKEAVEFVHTKYVKKAGGGKKTRLYVYGCSMGANTLGLYLIQEGEQALIDGAIMYGTPWETYKSSSYFYSSHWGFFSYAICVNLSNVWKEQFKQIKRFLQKKEVKRVEDMLALDAKSILPVDSTRAFVRILGKETLDLYFKAAAIGNDIVKIKVPTFALSAIDDIMCDPNWIPYNSAGAEESNVLLCTTNKGNHVCHFSGANSDFIPEQWFPQPFKMFLDFLEQKAISQEK